MTKVDKHAPTECTKTPYPIGYHYKNGSHQFECPACKRVGWYSRKWLSQGAVFCNGQQFSIVRVLRDLRKLCAA